MWHLYQMSIWKTSPFSCRHFYKYESNRLVYMCGYLQLRRIPRHHHRCHPLENWIPDVYVPLLRVLFRQPCLKTNYFKQKRPSTFLYRERREIVYKPSTYSQNPRRESNPSNDLFFLLDEIVIDSISIGSLKITENNNSVNLKLKF